MKTHIERMLRAMAWADREALRVVRDSPQAQGEALPLLAHLVAVEHIWLARLQGRDAKQPHWPQLSLAECDSLAAENATGYLDSVGRLSDAELGAAVRYRNTKGEEFVTPIIDILTHVVIHGAYHRGQIAKALGRCGCQPANTEYMTFVRVVEPAAAGKFKGDTARIGDGPIGEA
jgi:uncharacterized damage-inducible protein DinB